MLTMTANATANVAVKNLKSAQRTVDVFANRVGTGLRVAGALDDASNFTIAQGVRSEVRAWQAVSQGLGNISGAVKVAVASATNISDMIGVLKEKFIEYFATDTERKPIIEADINALLDQIDLMANAATFGATNFINVDQADLVFTAPPDQGTVFSFNGPGSNNHALGSQPGLLQVDYTAVGTGGGQIRIVYNGSTVSFKSVNPPNTNDSLSFAYDASGPASFTVEKTGSPNVDTDYSFTLTPTGLSGFPGDFEVLKGLDGRVVDIQHRSLTSADLGLRPAQLNNINSALGQIEAAQREVADALGYYGAKFREVEQARDIAQGFVYAHLEGLGNIVDSDLARDSAQLVAAQVRQELAMQSVSIASGSSKIALSLFS